jgi:hypothetical protein
MDASCLGDRQQKNKDPDFHDVDYCFSNYL